jgi:alpha-methylacyl-CoA racemase
MLADNGASVLRIDRAVPGRTHSNNPPLPSPDPLTRRKTSVAVDLKSKAGLDFVKQLVKHADVIIDPFRPGVLEKLGLGPDVLEAINPGIILGRMTGFRRDGKYKTMAGHDINYIAVSGALSLWGRKDEKPHPPNNIIGDFAGGGANLFQGILLALLARKRDGKGQVVEANMVDGSSYLTTYPRLLLKTPLWERPRGENLLDGGAPYYETYETSDGKFMAVGAMEPQFFAELMTGLEMTDLGYEKTRDDRKVWPELKKKLGSKFKSKTRAEWEKVFDGTDACVTPVLELRELETDKAREGDIRPAVTLVRTPSLAIKTSKESRDVVMGQGEGAKGDGWTTDDLIAGVGGEATLQQWLGWTKGSQYDVERGGLVSRSGSKL